VTTPVKTRRGEGLEAQNRILTAIDRLAAMQHQQGEAAERRHVETRNWQVDFRREQDVFVQNVKEKFSEVDRAIDEIRTGTAKALSLAEELAKSRAGGGGDAGALEQKLKETEERLSKFVIEEITKMGNQPGASRAPQWAGPANAGGGGGGAGGGSGGRDRGRGSWNDREEDFGVLVGGFPLHTRASKVEETLKELLRKHNARAVDSFSLGKRTQYGMIKMGSKEEAWEIIRKIKGVGGGNVMGMQLWATKSYPKEERDRTQGLRRAAWAVRKVMGDQEVDMDVDYTRLRLFIGDFLVGSCSATSEFSFDEAAWASAMPTMPLQRVRSALADAFPRG
jgi:hypothetical protein